MRSVEELIASLDAAAYLWNAVETLSKTFRNLSGRIAQGLHLAAGTEKRIIIDRDFDTRLASVIPEIKQTKQFEMFEAIRQSQQAIVRFFGSVARDTQLDAIDPSEALEDYSSAYQAFFVNQTSTDVWNLLVSAERLSRKQLALRSAVLFYLASAGPPKAGDDETLTIFITADLSLSEIAKKLAALADLYGEIAMLLKISVEQHPLRVLKVETDSLLISVAGHPLVIAIVTAISTASVMTLQQHWTQHGKIEQAEYELKALREAFDLTEVLRAKGVNVEGSEDRIKKASEIAVKRLTNLIGGETSVEINGELYVLSMDQSAKLLESQQQRRLENGPDKDVP